MFFTDDDIIYPLCFPLYSSGISISFIIGIPNHFALSIGQLIRRTKMVVVIMVELNACFDDGFVITIPAFYYLRFIIGGSQSISYPNKLCDRLKAVLLIDYSMRMRMGSGVLLELTIAIP